MTFVNDVRLPELGTGAGFALWAFRAIASGCGGCGVLRSGFERAFGSESAEALNDMICFARTLGNRGTWRISLAAAGCCRVTADELCVIATLSSAQQHDSAQCLAHLNWLMGGKNTNIGFRDASRISDKFSSVGLAIAAPEVELIQPQKTIEKPILNIVGNA